MPARLQERALCEFRRRVLDDSPSQHEFQRLIDRLVVFAPTLHNTFQNLNSLEIVSTVCSLNRLYRTQQAMNRALEVLAVRYPEWLRKIALPHWYGRYNPAFPRQEMAVLPGQHQFLLEEIASDIHQLLEKVRQSGLQELSALSEIKGLAQVSSQPFQPSDPLTNGGSETPQSIACHLCFQNGGGRRHQT
jgi:hypothetical protein